MHGWDLGDLAVPESAVSVLVTRTYAREHPEVVEAFLRGIAEGVAFLKQGQSDPAARARSLEIVADRLRVQADVVAPELDKIAELARVELAPDMANLADYQVMVARLTPGVENISPMAALMTSSKYPATQPPSSNPPVGSSCGPPGACMTPSRVIKLKTIIFLILFYLQL